MGIVRSSRQPLPSYGWEFLSARWRLKQSQFPLSVIRCETQYVQAMITCFNFKIAMIFGNPSIDDPQDLDTFLSQAKGNRFHIAMGICLVFHVQKHKRTSQIQCNYSAFLADNRGAIPLTFKKDVFEFALTLQANKI